ncbi:hypothetical protein WHP46_05865 [Campylobacter jejuni]
MGVESGEVFTTVDFGKMSINLIEQAQKQNKNTFVDFNQEIIHIEKKMIFLY